MRLFAQVLLALATFVVLGCITPEMNMPPLLDKVGLKYQGAAAEVSNVLKKEGEDPSEFYADIAEKDNGAFFVFRLVHKNTFLLENRNAIGNPSGKDREIVVDTRTGRATRSFFYQ